MSKLDEAVSVYGALNAIRNRKEIIEEIAFICLCSTAYASTLYAKAKKMNLKSIPSKGHPSVPSTTTATKPSTIEVFDRASVKQMREEFQAAVDAVAERHGLTAGLGNIRFSAGEFTCKITVETSGNAVVKADLETGMFEVNAMQVGLSPDSFGKTFTRGNNTFRITNVKPRRRKYPVSAENVRTGGKFKFPVSATGMSL